MSNYEKDYCSLADLGFISRGRSQHRPRNAPHLYGGEYPFIQTADITRSSLYITEYTQTYTKAGLDQSRLWRPGVLCIANAGVNTADNAILSFPACFPDSVIGFLPDEKKCNVFFIKYYLDSIKTQIKSITMGATQDNLSVSKLITFPIPKLSLDTQNKIAAILTAYDDLIENNKRRIAILEKMAEEIYREWFVRFRFPGYQTAGFEKGIPKGWVPIRFDSICKFEKGKNPNVVEEHLTEGLNTYINMDTLTGGASSFARKEKNSVIASVGDLLMLMDGSRSGLIFRSFNHGIVGSTLSVIRTSEYMKNFVYEYLRATNEAIISNNTGSAIPHANKEFINRMLMSVPKDRAIIEKFNAIYDAQYALSENIKSQNSQLESSKRQLLPRLISGKLSVENLEIQFPPSMQNEINNKDIA
jgi:type I restriction enzyme, S subunit